MTSIPRESRTFGRGRSPAVQAAAEARWLWDGLMGQESRRSGVRWAVWKQPGQTRYRVRATYGQEPDTGAAERGPCICRNSVRDGTHADPACPWYDQ